MAGIHELAAADGLNPLMVDDHELAAYAQSVEVVHLLSLNVHKLIQSQLCVHALRIHNCIHVNYVSEYIFDISFRLLLI